MPEITHIATGVLAFIPDSTLPFKSFDDIVIETPCLFLTAHSGKMSIFRLRKRLKSSIFSGFLHSLRWFGPQKLPRCFQA